MATQKIMQFKTEVTQLLDLVVHSLYSNKEIFLRELISNASDANDKLRFLAIDDDSLFSNDSELKIRIDIDNEQKTITITDNGIGMTEEEIIENLGTIAKSGTKEFLTKLTGNSKNDSHLIGQFGVGFYSAFIVADQVTVRSKRAGDSTAVQWVCSGENSYEISSTDKETRGTEIILHIKSSEEEFLNDFRIKNIVKKYSDHIMWPIEMLKAPESQDDKEPKLVSTEYEAVNKAKAMWTLAKSDISDEEYREFYKHISHDFYDPAIWSHNKVEGKTEYTSLLYIPTNAPYDINNREQKHGLHLYVQRVYIMDNASQFLPNYLRFIKGLVDSSDLPLNISREILQTNPLVNSIKNAITKKSLSLISKLSNDQEKYGVFWREFGSILREGIVEDFSNKDEVAKLIRFATTKSKEATELHSLHDYIGRMQPNQDKIYYITANSFNTAKNSPHLEIFNKQGIEVILFTDRIDEWVVNHLSEFEGKQLQSVAHGELPEDMNADQATVDEKDSSDICNKIKEVIKEKVKSVRVSKRLTDSPACLVAEQGEMSREMLKILQASGQPTPNLLSILEVNVTHPLIQKIAHTDESGPLEDLVNIIYDQAILSEGGTLDNPGVFVNRLNKILVQMHA